MAAGAGKSLMSLLADLEERGQLIDVIGAGDRLVRGVIVAGNREVMWLQVEGGAILYVFLASVFYIEEVES